MRQDPEKEDIGEAVQEDNEWQTSGSVKGKAYNEACKAGIENLVEGTVSWVHETKQKTCNYQSPPRIQQLLKPGLEDWPEDEFLDQAYK